MSAPHLTQNFAALPPTAQINVTYVGFSPEAKTAFQAAVNIWQTQIHSTVPINVIAHWTDLTQQYGDPGILGAAGPMEFVENFSKAPRQNVYYPIALANAIQGADLLPATSCSADPTDDIVNPSGAEISASFNSTSSIDNGQTSDWYYGTDGRTPANKVDLESVVLHELGHGLGFVGTNQVSGDPGTGVGVFGITDAGHTDVSIFDTFVADGAGHPLDTTYGFQTQALGDALRGADWGLEWIGPAGDKAAGGLNKPLLYAPNPFEAGSSFSHLDENSYPAFNPDALMTPELALGEAEHSPGPLMLGMFKDMGWPQANVSTGDYHPVASKRLVSQQNVTNAQALDVPVAGVDNIVPATGATAVVVNVTVQAPTKTGIWATFPGCSNAATTASQNFQAGAGQARTTQAVLALDVSGHVHISLTASPSATMSGIVSVDLVGWYGTNGVSYHQLAAPKQVWAGAVTSAPVDVKLAGVAGVPASGATAVVLSAGEGFGVTPGFLLVGPGGVNSIVPTVGYTYAELTQNLAIVPVGTGTAAGKIRIRVNTGHALGVLNVIGWYGPSTSTGLNFHPAGPTRLSGAPHGADVTVGGLPVNTAVMLDVHVAGPTATATLSAAPGGSPVFTTVQEVRPSQNASGTTVVTTNANGQVHLHLSAGAATFYTDFQGWFSS